MKLILDKTKHTYLSVYVCVCMCVCVCVCVYTYIREYNNNNNKVYLLYRPYYQSHSHQYNNNNKVYLLYRRYYQSHSKALFNKTFYAEQIKENIIDFEKQPQKGVSSEETQRFLKTLHV